MLVNLPAGRIYAGMSRSKPDCVADLENSANDTPLSLTLRERRATLTGPTYWIIIGTVVILAALAGPYSTLERLSFPERLVYWGTTVLSSAVLMTFLSLFAYYRLTEARGWNWGLVSLMVGAAGILPVVGSLYFAEGLATGFGQGWSEWASFSSLMMSVAPPLVAVTFMINLAIRLNETERSRTDMAPPNETDGQIVSPSLLQRKLPPHLGHDIVAVRAKDHYVEVTTPKGSAMVLMRLGDAVQHLEPVAGLQVHRSWWINLSHVAHIEKGANGTELVMTTDQRIPVGRSFRAAFQAATQRQIERPEHN